jgi:diaminopimelate epimerase
MRLKFTKMQGAGNDFVVLDATHAPLALSPAQLRHLGDRRWGVGADQILVVERSNVPGVDFRYRIFNAASGAEVEHCGNGARCFLRYVHDRGLTDRRRVRVQTVNNLLTLQLQADGRVSVDMNHPVFDLARVPFDASGLQPREQTGFALWPLPADDGSLLAEVAVLSMGNPHAVLRVDDVNTAPVAALGPRIEHHRRFPQRVNVGFVQVLAPDAVRLRVHERDAGETLACGTGACAAVVAGIRLGWLARAVEVHTRGGALRIEWPADDATVYMTGPAEFVFDGEIDLPEAPARAAHPLTTSA